MMYSRFSRLSTNLGRSGDGLYRVYPRVGYAKLDHKGAVPERTVAVEASHLVCINSATGIVFPLR